MGESFRQQPVSKSESINESEFKRSLRFWLTKRAPKISKFGLDAFIDENIASILIGTIKEEPGEFRNQADLDNFAILVAGDFANGVGENLKDIDSLDDAAIKERLISLAKAYSPAQTYPEQVA